MTLTPLLSVSLIGALCIACQWIAWRTRLPAIVLLSLVGLVLGPGTHLLNPIETFGPYLRTLISAAVAIILFDGGLGLKFSELKDIKRTIVQMVIIGAPLGWLLVSSAGHFIAGLSWPVAIVLGGILVVTGPTVILPLLRQAKLQPRAAAVLKWEGIVNDPLGAIFAVIAFEYFADPDIPHSPNIEIAILLIKIVTIAAAGFMVGTLIRKVFHHGHVPEFLKQPVVLITVLLTYAIANMFQDEGGLVAVTLLGITLANSDLPNLEEMRRFKEYLSLLLVSLVFILITATLRVQDLELLDTRAILFIVALLVVLRPITVLCSTINSGMTKQELLFVGWIAPRGIVCAAVSGLFGPRLVELGYPDGAKMVPLAFGIVFATVIGHGFTLRPWGRKLGLIYSHVPGLLIVGCNPFTVSLAKSLKDLNIFAVISDTNWHHLRLARLANLPLHYGDALSEDAESKLELGRFGELIAATDNPSRNALIATHFAHEFGREHISRLAVEPATTNPSKASYVSRHVPTILEGTLHDEVIELMRNGWTIKTVRLTSEFTYSDLKENYAEGIMPILSITEYGIALFNSNNANPQESGYTLIALATTKNASIS